MICIITTYLDIGHKSVFDHLLEDVQTLKKMAIDVSVMESGKNERFQKGTVIEDFRPE